MPDIKTGGVSGSNHERQPASPQSIDKKPNVHAEKKTAMADIARKNATKFGLAMANTLARRADFTHKNATDTASTTSYTDTKIEKKCRPHKIQPKDLEAARKNLKQAPVYFVNKVTKSPLKIHGFIAIGEPGKPGAQTFSYSVMPKHGHIVMDDAYLRTVERKRHKG